MGAVAAGRPPDGAALGSGMEGSILRLRGRLRTNEDGEKREQEFRLPAYFKRPPRHSECRPAVALEFVEGAVSTRTATASGTWRTRALHPQRTFR